MTGISMFNIADHNRSSCARLQVPVHFPVLFCLTRTSNTGTTPFNLCSSRSTHIHHVYHPGKEREIEDVYLPLNPSLTARKKNIKPVTSCQGEQHSSSDYCIFRHALLVRYVRSSRYPCARRGSRPPGYVVIVHAALTHVS